jgi:hypothetical protein
MAGLGRLEDVDSPSPWCAFCSVKDQPLAAWPNHMQTVFRLIGTLMAGKRLSQDVLQRLPIDDRSIIPEHRVTISHTPAAQLGHKSGQYTIVITGRRIDGLWLLRPGQLERLSREAAAMSPNVR